MSSIPAHSAAGDATKPAPTPTSPLASSRRRWIILIVSAALVLTLGAWYLIHSMGQTEPRLNENTLVLSKFIANSSTFSQLPFEEAQRPVLQGDGRPRHRDRPGLRAIAIDRARIPRALKPPELPGSINRFESTPPCPPRPAPNYQHAPHRKDKKDQKKREVKKGPRGARSPHPPTRSRWTETAAELRVESWPSAAMTSGSCSTMPITGKRNPEKKRPPPAATKP